MSCNKSSHGPKNDRITRAKFCRAWSFTCAKCSVKGHFTSSCTKCSASGNWGHRDKSSKFCTQSPQQRANAKDARPSKAYQTEDDNTNYAFDQLCTSSTSTECNSTATQKPQQRKPLEHHVFDGQWVARPSRPHPIMTLQLTPRPEDHAILGFPMADTSKLSPINIPMIADSGYQSSIMPLRSAQSMGFGKEDIIPVRLIMRGAIRGPGRHRCSRY
ncbi:hypothetical protein EGW08_021884 [Elysia chlorotica]|uniref:Uncharacterized protein n=1 Tax=Elysia chlorotica TaxID=188477 RepID=A0A3S0ZLT4_ELYCH|nr:hypothetical protein EGW08_021884 [Elysia chlorotica]